MKSFSKWIIITLLVSLITGCSSNNDNNEKQGDKEPEVIIQTPTDVELNSIAMLNYLTVVSEMIEQSSNNSFYLEEIYYNLLDNLNPNAIDKETQIRVNEMCDCIEDLLDNLVMRERLSDVFMQEKAYAFVESIPSATELVNGINLRNYFKTAVNIISQAIDSYSKYKSRINDIELQYFEEEWLLDDSLQERLNTERKRASEHINSIVSKYSLNSELVLSNTNAKELVEWENEGYSARVIQLLESNEQTYKAYGGYWLLLARNYYNAGNYSGCMEAIDKYISSQPKLFRHDLSLAETLPMAISSANLLLSGNNLIEKEALYTQLLYENCNNSNWDLKYFASLSLMDLYSQTKEKEYLRKAYEATKSNVLHMIKDQRDANDMYLNDVIEIEIPSDATQEEKKEIKNYNKMIKEIRETELPPVNRALLLNTSMLLSLARKLDYSIDSRDAIDKLLHKNDNGEDERLFLVEPIDDSLWTSTKEVDYISKYAEIIYFDGDALNLPASLLCDETQIKFLVNNEMEQWYDESWNWETLGVFRESDSIEGFEAYLYFYSADGYEYHDGDVVEFIIYPDGLSFDQISIVFDVEVKKFLGVIGKPKFILREN